MPQPFKGLLTRKKEEVNIANFNKWVKFVMQPFEFLVRVNPNLETLTLLCHTLPAVILGRLRALQ